MATYTTSDLSRKSGDIIADAMRRPVTITQRNKPRFVLLNIEDYQRLVERADPRVAGLTQAMPDDLFDHAAEALKAYETSDGQ